MRMIQRSQEHPERLALHLFPCQPAAHIDGIDFGCFGFFREQDAAVQAAARQHRDSVQAVSPHWWVDLVWKFDKRTQGAGYGKRTESLVRKFFRRRLSQHLSSYVYRG